MKYNYNDSMTIYINEAGLRPLVVKSHLPNASDVAKILGINEETRYLRTVIEIIGFVQAVLLEMMIPIEFQKNVNDFRIDLYLPDKKRAIEIDKNNHAYRDPIYEQEREQHIRLKLGCEFIRIHFEAEQFKSSSCVVIL